MWWSYSPEPDAGLLESALYRFEDPAVPGFILPAAGDWAPEEDVWLNVDNPIRDIDGSYTEAGCNGEIVSWGAFVRWSVHGIGAQLRPLWRVWDER